MKRLSENLKLIRKKRWRMSQDKFAELMNSSRSKINSYENGGVEPSIAFMAQLQVFSGIGIKDIFGSKLQLEKIPSAPLTAETNNLITFDEDKPAYDNAWVDLNNYHKQIAHRFKVLEDRIKLLEENNKNKF